MPNDPAKELDELAIALAQEHLDISDEELLREAAEVGDLRSIFASSKSEVDSILSGGTNKTLAEARRELVSFKNNLPANSKVVDIDSARKRLTEALGKGAKAGDKITLAARDGKGVSDADIQGLLDDADELGLFDTDGE